ncbi:MAG: TIGR04283 family arsenosugar biosynthesis glycosyltransferase [Nitrospiria bacterium]
MKEKRSGDFTGKARADSYLTPDSDGPDPKISLVVPIRNESPTLESFFAHLDPIPFHEVICVDGGSRDATEHILRKWASPPQLKTCRVIATAPRGRGRQMNTGAKHATGDILLFLHADSRLPAAPLDRIRQALQQPDIVGGAFRLSIDSPHLFLRFVSWMANIRSCLMKLPYGDQGYFVRKHTFEAMGGYREISLMEDVDFFRRLKGMGRIVLLNEAVCTSARRWKRHGYLRTSFRNLLILSAYFMGVSPNKLAQWYDGRHGMMVDEDA